MKGTFETPYGSSLIGNTFALGGGGVSGSVDSPCFPGFARPGHNVDLRTKLPEAIYPGVPTMAGTHIPKMTEAASPTETLGSIVGAFLDKLVEHVATETASKVIKQLDVTMAKLQSVDPEKLVSTMQLLVEEGAGAPRAYPTSRWDIEKQVRNSLMTEFPIHTRYGSEENTDAFYARAEELTELRLSQIGRAHLDLQDALRKLDGWITIERYAPGPVSIVVGNARSGRASGVEMHFYAGGLHSPMGWMCEPDQYCVISNGDAVGYVVRPQGGEHHGHTLDEVITMVKNQMGSSS